MATKNGSVDTVESKHSDVLAWESDSMLPRSLLKGTKGMKAKRKVFLPQDYLEKAANYEIRLERSILVNAFGKTVNFLGGQVFQKNLVFNDDVPKEVLEWNKDIDLKGTNIDTFAKRLFERGIGEGVVLLMVDTTNKDGEYTSKAAEREAGVRPYFREIKGEGLLAYIDDDGFLVQLRIVETVSQRLGEFGVENISQIRVLEPGKWRTYREVKGKWLESESGTTNLGYIPIVAYIPGEPESLVTGKTPLMDLAELNLGHWQSKSDQVNILHHARVPKLFSKMLDLEALENSPHNLINSNDEHGDLKYIEISGKAIEAGQKDLTELEAKMAMWGLQQLIPRTGNITATEKAISSAESNSSLGSWAGIFETFLWAAYEMMADIEKQTYPEEMVAVNREFAVGILDLEMVKSYIEMVEGGIMSAATAFVELKRRGFISDELDWLEVKLEIDNERQDSDLMAGFGKPKEEDEE